MSCQPHYGLLIRGCRWHRSWRRRNGESWTQYAVYFPCRYTVSLDLWIFVDKVKRRRREIDALAWSGPQMVEVIMALLAPPLPASRSASKFPAPASILAYAAPPATTLSPVTPSTRFTREENPPDEEELFLVKS